MLLDNKNVLITGVLTDASIAFHVARLAQEQGANVVLTSFGRTMSLTKRSAARLPKEVSIVELDVTSQQDLESLADRVREHVPHLDGVLHSIGFAPESALGGNFSQYPVGGRCHRNANFDLSHSNHWRSHANRCLAGAHQSLVLTLMQPLLGQPTTGWELPKRLLKAHQGTSLETWVPLGIRVNLVAAGPIRTMAAKSIPGFEEFENIWEQRAPLGWDVSDPTAAAQACVVLLSDWLPATSGEMIHVDGGMHSQGA